MRLLIDCMTLSKGAGLAHYIEGIISNLPEGITPVIIADRDYFNGKYTVFKPVFYNIITRLIYEHFIFPIYALKYGCSCMFLPKSYAPLMKTVCTVVSMHDLIPAGKKSGESVFHRIYWKIQFYAGLTLSDGIIYNTALLKREAERAYRKAVSKKSVICHYGYDTYEKQEKQREKHFLIPGTLKKRKNTDIALKLASELSKSFDKDIIVTGRPDRMKMISGDNRHFKYEGYVSESRMKELMNDAFAVIFLSSVEGFSLPVAESVFLGKTVIASDIPVHRHLYGDYPVYYNLSESIDKNAERIADEMRRHRIYEEEKRTWKQAGRETGIFIQAVCGKE